MICISPEGYILIIDYTVVYYLQVHIAVQLWQYFNYFPVCNWHTLEFKTLLYMLTWYSLLCAYYQQC